MMRRRTPFRCKMCGNVCHARMNSCSSCCLPFVDRGSWEPATITGPGGDVHSETDSDSDSDSDDETEVDHVTEPTAPAVDAASAMERAPRAPRGRRRRLGRTGCRTSRVGLRRRPDATRVARLVQPNRSPPAKPRRTSAASTQRWSARARRWAARSGRPRRTFGSRTESAFAAFTQTRADREQLAGVHDALEAIDRDAWSHGEGAAALREALLASELEPVSTEIGGEETEGRRVAGRVRGPEGLPLKDAFDRASDLADLRGSALAARSRQASGQGARGG